MNFPTKSHMIKQLRIYILLFIGFLVQSVGGQQVLPETSNPPKHIYDYAGVLSEDQLNDIEKFLMQYEDSTSTQIAVLIEPSLNGLDVFDRALFVARGWKIGQADKNNGVLLYIAVNDHKYYTIVANKAQAKLTDGRVGVIQTEELVPLLKQGDYYNAIYNTVNEYMKVLSDEFSGSRFKKKKSKFPKFIIPLIIIFLILVFRKRGNGGGGFGSGGFYPPPIWFGGSSSDSSSSSSSSDWGGFGGGGGFDGGGAGGSW